MPASSWISSMATMNLEGTAGAASEGDVGTETQLLHHRFLFEVRCAPQRLRFARLRAPVQNATI